LNKFLQINYEFLPYVQDIYEICKNKIKLYTYKKHPDYINPNTKWPGLRSQKLNHIEPFLHLLLLKEAENKFKFDPKLYREIHSYVHLRSEESNGEEFIHQDTCDTMLIYLSDSNLKSGTRFYSNEQEPISEVNFVQNTAVYFDGSIFHGSLKNYGDSIDNGRMTINIFCFR
jgi:hypothetical protein